MDDPGFGVRIRALRRREGLTQAQLAGKLDISPSYLNLIEHGKRALPASMLIRIAQLFQVDLASFTADRDRGLEAHLSEVFADPMFDEYGLVAADIRDLAADRPPMARAVVALYETWRTARDQVSSLSERLSAEDLPEMDRSHLSSEEINDLIQRRGNWFPELEEAAESLWSEARLDPNDIGPGLIRYLEEALAVRVEVRPFGEDGGATRRYDPERRELRLSEVLPPRARNFQLAHQIALLRHADVLDRLSRDELLTTDESRALCRVVLSNYYAGAVLMPYERILTAARQVRYDIELLGHRFRTSFEQVCHRLTTLRRPGSEGVPFHFLRVDVAGNISKRFSASGIRYPRFSGVCSRWNVFTAFMTPGQIRVQLSKMPDGSVFFCLARTVRRESLGYRGPQAMWSLGLGCRAEYARELVYSDGVAIDDSAAPEPIGVTCRTCDRIDCAQRACPPLLRPLRIDPHRRGVSLFAPEAQGMRSPVNAKATTR